MTERESIEFLLERLTSSEPADRLLAARELSSPSTLRCAEPEIGEVTVVLGVDSFQGIDDPLAVGGYGGALREVHPEEIVGAKLSGFRPA